MEDLRMLVQEEGRAARNLVAFHVDVASPTSGKAVNRKPPSSPRLVSEVRMTKRSASVTKTGSRVRSASLGRDKKSELQALGEARYWAFLFGNLERAVDDIYQTCETDESVSECKEAILVLENFTRDFHNLIKWFKLKKEYENTPPPQRPTSLAWEIRKSSPSKVFRFMTSKFDKGSKNEKPSPVKKQLNFCSDVKLSSAEEKSKPTHSENEQILSNQYGLSFGDVNLKEHLISEEKIILTEAEKIQSKTEESNSIKNKTESDRGNLLVIADDHFLTKTETQEYMSDQSSQTDSISCQIGKSNQKPAAPFTSFSKKPPPLTKSVINTSVKTSLTPLAVNKTVPGVSSRKTVPVSPTSTTAPRSIIPGRNVAAVTFVPSKKPLAQTQVKSAPGVPKTAPNVNKTSNIPTQTNEKIEEFKEINSSIDSKIAETKLDVGKITSNIAVVEKLQKNEKMAEIVNSQKITSTPTHDTSTKNIAQVPTKEVKSQQTTVVTRKDMSTQKSEETIKQNINDKESKSNSLEHATRPSSSKPTQLIESEKKVVCPSTSEKQSNTVVLKKSESTQCGEKTDTDVEQTSVSTESNVNENPTNIVKIIRRNVVKVDKCVMTDLPYVPKQPAVKVSSLVRNKTAPSLVRKSNEAINAPESVKPNSAINSPKPLVNTVKKQSSIPEVVNEKPAYAAVSKVFRSNTAIELRPKVSSGSRSNYSKFSIPGKQVREPDSDKTNLALNPSKPLVSALKRQPSIPEVNNQKPAYAAVSKMLRCNTSVELRTRFASSTKVNYASKSTVPGKQVCVPDSVKTNGVLGPTKPLDSDLKNPSRKPEVANKKPASTTASKMFRSNTSIELRPKWKSSSKVNNGSKYPLPGKQNSLQNGKSPSQTTSSSSSSVCKSEQGFRRRNSVDEDGWETVKGRSRYRLTQSFTNIKSRSLAARTRYHLPSPATSLPALTLAMEEPESESGSAKVRGKEVEKEKQNQEIAKALKTSPKKTNKLIARSTKDVLKSELAKPKSKSKEDVTEKKSKASMEDSNSKRFTNMKLKSTEIKKKAVKEDKIESQEVKIEKYMDILSSEDERMNEEEIRKSRELDEEEKMLTKEIQDLEKAEIDVDTETDEAETDGDEDTVRSSESEEDRIEALKASYENVAHNLSWSDQMEAMDKLERLMAQDTSTKGLPWAERMATLEQLEELVARSPGRALELHQKLSSPSRRRPLPDTIQRHTARQASAQLKRKQLLQEKQAKMRELVNKVEAVKMAQELLKTERMTRLENKQKRAEENRASHLRSIQRKAHDEEEKLREIAFINELEAQNKRHDFMTHCQEQLDRLQGIVDERQRKQEEKAAKEAAVEERKRIIEAERQDRLEKIQEKRRKREERIGREQQEKEKERLEIAREKARDREERLQALQAAQLANQEELQKKIQQKQFESARRHEENIEQIRQKALESGALRGVADDEAPTLTPYDTYKLCRICNVLIVSEVYLLSHLRGKAHQEAVKDLDDSEEVIIDAPADKADAKLAQYRERQKALRKRCKKLRTRMAQRGEDYLTKLSTIATKKLESPNKGRLFKCLHDVDKQHASQGVGQWPNNAVTMLERNLAEINRILDKQNALDQKVFRDLNGFTTISNILNLALDIPKNMSPYLPPKCFLTTCLVYCLACTNNPENSRFVFFSNKIAVVLDLLLNRLNALIPDDYKPSNKSSANLPSDPIAGALMKLFSLILMFSQENVTGDVPDMSPRMQDIISYTVCVGVVDKLALYCGSVRDPIDNNTQAASFLLNAIQLLTTLAQTKCGLLKGDPTQLVATLKVTELVGGVSMLYGMLLHQGTPARDPSSPPPELPSHTITVTRHTLQLLIAVAQLDLHMFQSVLGAEGVSLQLRHIASYLLWYCSYSDQRELLHKVIEVVGYFAVNHYDNQMILQSGHMPTVLQQLCNLPFEYFSDPALSCELFPTLLACCYNNADNRAILEQELSYQLLEDFKQSAKSNELIKLMSSDKK